MQKTIERAVEHKTKDRYWLAGKNNYGYLGEIWACEIVTLKHPLEERTFYNGKDHIVIPINKDEELLKLYHYETLIAIINMTTGKIEYTRNERWSLSDRNGLSTVAYYLKKIKGVEIEDYEFIHGHIYYGEQIKKWKERNAKIREKMINKFDSFKDAIPILEELGFEVFLVNEDFWTEFFKENSLGIKIDERYNPLHTSVVFVRPNKIVIKSSEKTRLVVTDMTKKLNDVVILKTVYYDKYEFENFKKLYIYDVRLIGIDETHQYWSLRLPVNYYFSKIPTCERWVMGISEEHEVVQER